MRHVSRQRRPCAYLADWLADWLADFLFVCLFSFVLFASFGLQCLVQRGAAVLHVVRY